MSAFTAVAPATADAALPLASGKRKSLVDAKRDTARRCCCTHVRRSPDNGERRDG
jgi:hypothetical protein